MKLQNWPITAQRQKCEYWDNDRPETIFQRSARKACPISANEMATASQGSLTCRKASAKTCQSNRHSMTDKIPRPISNPNPAIQRFIYFIQTQITN